MTRHIVTRGDHVDELRQTWRTPPDFARNLVDRFDVTLDAAAHTGNAVVPNFLGPGSPIGDDAIKATAWGYLAPFDGAAFCNPPFRRALDFVKAGVAAVRHPARPLRAAVFLLPCNLDTRWARLLWEEGATFYAITGRLRFAPPVDFDGAPVPDVADHRGAAFPMVIVALHRARGMIPDGPRALHLMDTDGALL